METMTKTYEQKKTTLNQRLELAKELGLVSQVAMLEMEMQEVQFEQVNTYQLVTKAEAQKAMCQSKSHKHGSRWMSCRHILFYQLATIKEWPVRCGKTGIHEHVVYAQEIASESIGFGQKVATQFGEFAVQEITRLPMAAMLRLKEAKEKGFTDFEVWRPETNDEKLRRELDPWLVGVRFGKFYKLCDWR